MVARRSEAESLVDRHFGPEIGRLCQFSALYQIKVEEAERCVAGGGIGALMAAELVARPGPAGALAGAILARADEMRVALGTVEMLRLAAKDRVRAAATPAALETVLSELGISR
jgi:hypothetical protein